MLIPAQKRRSDADPSAKPAGGGRRWDWPVLLVCAVSSLAVGLSSPPDTSQQAWGICAAAGYLVAALVALKSAKPWARIPAVISLIGAAVMPLLYLTVISKEQMEVGVVERGADLLFSSGTPYNATPHIVADFNPYLPGMTLFGIPHMLFGDTPLGSARLWFLLGFLAAAICAVRVLAKGSKSGSLGLNENVGGGMTGGLGLLWLIACPLVSLPLAIGGVDPPVIGLLCLALAFAHRGDAGRAGLALGAAAALKWTAWPAIPVLVIMFAVTRGKRAAVKCALGSIGLAVISAIPVALVDGGAFYQNVVLYPLGLGSAASSAQSPLLGSLIVSLVPNGKAVTVVLIALSALGVGISLLVRPPRTTVAAANRLSMGLILAIVLSPATRIGYLIYPVVLLVWPRFAAGLASWREGDDREVTAPADAPQPVADPDAALAPNR
ncbi:glycosyltransferase 87 family protein [Streptomyces sp. NPDC050161]|uniref:glycosyltransferase 87 family protein n=1 Tax=Streptomyces sp. NPDC050161 TaxID=3365604 RepID=UPI003793F2EE